MLGVGGEQAAVDEGLQLDEHLTRQLVAADAPPGGAALFVDGDQAEQFPDHLVAVAAAGGNGLGQGGVGLPGQGPLNAAELLVAGGGDAVPAGDAVGELSQGVGQQGQGLSAAGVSD
jgi:hypothetical protein